MTDTAILTSLASLFVEPIDIPTNPVALLWAVPICLSISMVYQAIKVDDLSPKVFIREVLLRFVTIIACLFVVALVLLAIARLAS